MKFKIEYTSNEEVNNKLCNGDLKFVKGKYEQLEYFEYDNIEDAIKDFIKLSYNRFTKHCMLHAGIVSVDFSDLPSYGDLIYIEVQRKICSLEETVYDMAKEIDCYKRFIQQYNAVDSFEKFRIGDV